MFLGKFGSCDSGTGQFAFPIGISIDSDDRVHFSDSWNHCIQVFHPDCSFIANFDGNICIVPNFKTPYGPTIAPDSNLFIAGYSSNAMVVSHEGQFVRGFDLERETGVDFDAAGFSLVTTYANLGFISIFDAKGRLIHKMGGFNNLQVAKISFDGFVWISKHCGN